MAQSPTSDELARNVLDVYKSQNALVGHSNLPNVFLAHASKRGWHHYINESVNAAIQFGYIEKNGDQYSLTQAGFEAM